MGCSRPPWSAGGRRGGAALERLLPHGVEVLGREVAHCGLEALPVRAKLFERVAGLRALLRALLLRQRVRFRGEVEPALEHGDHEADAARGAAVTSPAVLVVRLQQGLEDGHEDVVLHVASGGRRLRREDAQQNLVDEVHRTGAGRNQRAVNLPLRERPEEARNAQLEGVADLPQHPAEYLPLAELLPVFLGAFVFLRLGRKQPGAVRVQRKLLPHVRHVHADAEEGSVRQTLVHEVDQILLRDSQVLEVMMNRGRRRTQPRWRTEQRRRWGRGRRQRALVKQIRKGGADHWRRRRPPKPPSEAWVLAARLSEDRRLL